MTIENCTIEVDESRKVLTVYTKYSATILKIKFEERGWGTMERAITEGYEKEDADNWWCAFKPSDNVVFEKGLFTKKKLVIDKVDYELKDKLW